MLYLVDIEPYLVSHIILCKLAQSTHCSALPFLLMHQKKKSEDVIQARKS